MTGKAKLSKNFFKRADQSGKFVNMLTYRSTSCGSQLFKEEVEMMKQLLQDNNFSFEKVEVEFSIYDTNVTHDAKWINE